MAQCLTNYAQGQLYPIANEINYDQRIQFSVENIRSYEYFTVRTFNLFRVAERAWESTCLRGHMSSPILVNVRYAEKADLCMFTPKTS
jgi:hypothetical protein